MEKKVQEDIIEQINNKFGIESMCTTNWGEVLEEQGMIIGYKKGKAKFR